MKFLKDLFNKRKVESLERELEKSNAINDDLIKRVHELEDYKLMYEIADLYINDEEAILELLEIKKKEINRNQDFYNHQMHNMQQRNSQQSHRGMLGNFY